MPYRTFSSYGAARRPWRELPFEPRTVTHLTQLRPSQDTPTNLPYQAEHAFQDGVNSLPARPSDVVLRPGRVTWVRAQPRFRA